jgi:MFS transporter, NAG-T family, sugar:H+ symporter
MILLAFTFFYTGIELSFFSGVYSSSVGFTNNFTEAKRLVGLCGILVGLGEVIGGATFGLLGSRTVKHGTIDKLTIIVHKTSF